MRVHMSFLKASLNWLYTHNKELYFPSSMVFKLVLKMVNKMVLRYIVGTFVFIRH